LHVLVSGSAPSETFSCIALQLQHVMLPATFVRNNLPSRGLESICKGLNSMCWLARAMLLLQGAPKLKVAIVGGGLAGLSTAVELLDQG
jgi:hypothetical protein